MAIPSSSGMAYRYMVSAILGVALFLFYFQPFLPYSQRPELSPKWWLFPVIVLIGGFLLSLGLAPRRFWIVPTCLLLTLFAANVILIVVDSFTEAFDRHNLAPIEFILIALLTLPAYLGALIAAAVGWFRARGVEA
jgi:hypothetical protein